MSIQPHQKVKYWIKTLVVVIVVWNLLNLSSTYLPRILWRALGAPVPAASAFLTVAIHNDSKDTVIATVTNLNDRHFVVESLREQQRREIIGWRLNEEVMLLPDQQALISLPSEVEPRLAMMEVIVRTQVISQGSDKAAQRLAIYLLDWNSLGKCEEPGTRPMINIVESDLRGMTLSDDIRSCVPVLRPEIGCVPENQLK